VNDGARLRQNVDGLEESLALARRSLAAAADHEGRAQHGAAIEQFSRYVELLREEAARLERRALSLFGFKLVFPDGRWDVAEVQLSEPPSLGDVVELEDHTRWQIDASQVVRSRPVKKPDREFFVCSPAM
jgi:hypothetical protein